MCRVTVAQSCPTLCHPTDCTVHGILRPEYWSGEPFPAPGDLPNPGIQPKSPELQAYSLPAETPSCKMPGWWLTVQFSSVTQSCPTLCHRMNRSTPGFPAHYQLPEFTQSHVHWVGDAIQPSHPLSSPSPPALSLSQHQGLSDESALCIRWPEYWSFSFNISPSNIHPGLISFRMD